MNLQNNKFGAIRTKEQLFFPLLSLVLSQSSSKMSIKFLSRSVSSVGCSSNLILEQLMSQHSLQVGLHCMPAFLHEQAFPQFVVHPQRSGIKIR